MAVCQGMDPHETFRSRQPKIVSDQIKCYRFLKEVANNMMQRFSTSLEVKHRLGLINANSFILG